MSTTDTLRMSETFLSIQGEGSTVGALSVFLRLQFCNLTCPGWGKGGCDSTAVWKTGNEYSFEKLLDLWKTRGLDVALRNGAHLIITGGEPLIQGMKLGDFLLFLYHKLFTRRDFIPHIEFETNGTLIPQTQVCDVLDNYYTYQFNCSPKLSSAGNAKDKCWKPDALKWFASHSNTNFKFVITSEHFTNDLSEVEDFMNKFFVPSRRIWLMPQGATREEQDSHSLRIVNACLTGGFNYSPRLHINIWDQATGV